MSDAGVFAARLDRVRQSPARGLESFVVGQVQSIIEGPELDSLCGVRAEETLPCPLPRDVQTTSRSRDDRSEA